MDEKIVKQAEQKIAAWRSHMIKQYEPYKQSHVPSNKEYYKKRLEELEKAVPRHLKNFKDYCEHVATCVLVQKPALVRKVNGSFWSFEKNRLQIAPLVMCESKKSKTRVHSVAEFNRFNVDYSGKKSPCIPRAGYKSSIINDLVPLVHLLCKDRLDELDAQLRVIERDVMDHADEILRNFKAEVSGEEQKKFEAKLLAFLRENQFFSDADPNFLLACFNIEPGTLERLSQFLRIHKVAINFITVENIADMQELAKVAEVHDA